MKVGLLLLPTKELIAEFSTFEAYFGFYPGGAKAVIRDLVLGANGMIRQWDKSIYESWYLQDDVLPKAIDYLEMEEFNLEKVNTRSADFTELERIVVTAIEEFQKKVFSMILNVIGNSSVLTLYRGEGNRWTDNDLLIQYHLK